MRRAVSTLLILAVAAVSAPTAQAYVILKTWGGKNKHWTQSSVSWTATAGGIPGLSNDQFEAALQGAFDAWEDVGCATIAFTANGLKWNDPGNSIHTTVNTNSWDPSVGDALAYTMTDNNNNGIISSSDIVFNAVETTWTVSSNAPPGKSDVQGVMTHEIGHAIGIDHTRHFASTMFFSGGSSKLRTLEIDDEHAACYLYPAVDFDDGKACDTCHDTSHCADGYCLDFGGGNGFCGETCGNSADCDDGFTCTLIQGGQNQCLPDNEYCDQYGSNIGLGGFCFGHATCSSSICLVLPDEAYCSKQCTSSCPGGFACVSGYCLKSGSKPYGAACELSGECKTGTCIKFSGGGVCTQACGDNGGGPCPDGNQCLQDVYCLPPGSGGNGSPCYIGSQCQGTYCEDDKCTEPCTSSATCPEGSSCSGGWCVGAEIGGGCTSNAECPAGLACFTAGPGLLGTCVHSCSPLMENACVGGEVCVWQWQDWNEEITGSCQEKTGGGGEGDDCDASNPCELDLICAEGAYGDMVCSRDCKIYANNLGCAAGYKCVDLEDPNDPKKGYCVLKNPPPLPAEDTSTTPIPDTIEPEDTGPVPDTDGPSNDVHVDLGPGADTATPPGVDILGPGSDEPVPGPGGGGGNGSGCGAGPTSADPSLLLWMCLVLGALLRRRETVRG